MTLISFIRGWLLAIPPLKLTPERRRMFLRHDMEDTY